MTSEDIEDEEEWLRHRLVRLRMVMLCPGRSRKDLTERVYHRCGWTNLGNCGSRPRRAGRRRSARPITSWRRELQARLATQRVRKIG